MKLLDQKLFQEVERSRAMIYFHSFSNFLVRNKSSLTEHAHGQGMHASGYTMQLQTGWQLVIRRGSNCDANRAEYGSPTGAETEEEACLSLTTSKAMSLEQPFAPDMCHNNPSVY